MKKKIVKKIPETYLIKRWQKGIIRIEELKKKYAVGEGECGFDPKVKEVYSIFAECINMVGHDDDAMSMFLGWKNEIKAKIIANPPKPDARSKKAQLDSFIGVEVPDHAPIRNPRNIRNKGCGTSKRMKGKKEIALTKPNKDPRSCTYCHEVIPPNEKHDRRNCPVRKALEEEGQLIDESSEEEEGTENEVSYNDSSEEEVLKDDDSQYEDVHDDDSQYADLEDSECSNESG